MSNSEDYDDKFGGAKEEINFKHFVSYSSKFWIKTF